MLKSRTTFPPGGWTFFQPQTGKSFGGLTFLQTVDAIIEHRRANPRFNLSLNPDAVAKELDNFTCARLNHDKNYCVSESAASFSKPPLPQRQSAGGKGGSAAVGRTGKYLANTTVGIGLFLKWFGDGRPAPKELAEKRAAICLSGCPKHVHGNITQRFNAAAAQEIMSIFSVLHDLDLHTSQEEKLGVCDACDCAMKAKVFTPLSLIKTHLRKEASDALWEKCWIRTEGLDTKPI